MLAPRAHRTLLARFMSLGMRQGLRRPVYRPCRSADASGGRNPMTWGRAWALRGSPARFLALRRPCSGCEPLPRTCHYPAQPGGTAVGVSRAIAIDGRPVNIDISAINGIGSAADQNR